MTEQEFESLLDIAVAKLSGDVRISHAPRFVLEMDRDSSLFKHMRPHPW